MVTTWTTNTINGTYFDDKVCDVKSTCFDWVMAQLGYKCMEDWYNVTVENIHKNGGGSLLNRYKGSPSLALQSVYPEHNWELERSSHKPRNFWKNKENQKNLLDCLHNQFGHKCMEDWYNVTAEDIQKNGGVT